MRLVLFIAVLSSALFAHTSGSHGGFMPGLLHPLGGLDHILAMIGVGLVAGLGVQKPAFAIGSFMGAMIVAALAGFGGLAVAGVEAGILLSVAGVFAMIGFAKKLPAYFILAAVAFFGLFHGFAHGAEFVGGSFAAYIAGFSLSTLGLHLLGYAVSFVLAKKLSAPAAA